ncbi:FG-GAP-like repeat-containing protein [Streptomyces nondiastaticus]|uniref:FG-GAP-like repeat-containing protein n=1 Tax=Streptomyces nondiastaticus TaxID=3154512 RepID=A0ABW6U5F9_9ACTN
MAGITETAWARTVLPPAPGGRTTPPLVPDPLLTRTEKDLPKPPRPMTLPERRKQLDARRGSTGPMREFVQPRPPARPATPEGPPAAGALQKGPAASGKGTRGAPGLKAPAGTAPNPDWVSAYATAYPGMLSIGGQVKFSGIDAAKLSSMWLYVMDEEKKPVLQQEIKKADADPRGRYLESGAWCYGWWPKNSYPADQCFWWTSSLLNGHLKDGKKYYAWIFLTATDGSSSPGGTTSPFVEAFYTPDIPGAQAGLCTCYAQEHRADPINTATGMYYEKITDATLAGAGKPFSLDRYYRSDSTATGLLGRGWSTPFDSKLTLASGSATLQTDDGAQVVFTLSNGAYTTPAGSVLKLAKSGSSYVLTSIDHTRRTYNASGQLTAVTDASGHGLTIGYASGRPTTVKDTAGRTVEFTVDDSGLLTKAVLPGNTTVVYGYTGGLLTSATDQLGKTTTYTYDGAKRLATFTDAEGGKVTNAYDAAGRVKSQTDSSGKTTTLTWDNKRESHVTDPNGGVWTDVYSGNVLVESTDPYGKTVSYSYDRQLHPVSITDRLGNTTEMTYDGAGRMLTRKAPASAGYTESWTYDGAGNVTSHTDGRGKTSTYTYTSDNQLATSTDPAGGTVTYTYAPLGSLASVRTPRGKTVTYDHDAAGNRTAVTTPLGEKTTFRYDAAGRITEKTDPRGNAQGANPADFTTTYTYDGRGLLRTAKDPLGHTTVYGYDGVGRLTSVKDATGRTATYEYDGENRLTKTVNPAGKAATRAYDANGNLTTVTDALGNKTTYAYDKANRLIAEVSPRGNAQGADAAAYTTSYGYDANGNRTTVTDPTGAVTTTSYDSLGRPVSVTDPLKHVTKTTYDAADNIATVTDALGKVTRYTYTDTGLTESVTDPLGKKTTYGYDADGHRTSDTSPLGRKTTWTYDDDGRTATRTDPRGNAQGANPADFTTTYTYDDAGNLTKVRDPLGGTTVTAYDALGHVVSATDPLGKATTTAYDELGRVAKVTGPDGAVTAYTYNTAGDLATRTDPKGHTTSYAYDDAGRRTEVTDPLGRKKTFGYDADGNTNRITNARGTTATVAFDPRGLPTATAFTDDTPGSTLAYDALGRRKSVTDATGTRTYAYDPAGRLTAVTPGSGKGAYGYTYDDAGHLTSRTVDYTAPEPLDWSGSALTATGDLNSDGTTDVIATDAKSGVRTFLGRADGTFTAGSTLTGTGIGFQQILTVEFTGDGKPDLLTIDKATGHLWRHTGDGKGGFAAPADLGAGWGPMTLTAGDFNQDGKADLLAISSSANRLYFYPGDGKGGFGDRTDLGNGWGSYRIALLEYTGDGKPDILAVNPGDGHLYLYPGDGKGGFGNRTDLGAGWGAMHLVPGEFNGDGKQDFLAVDTAARKLRFYPGNGTGGFGTYVLQSDDWTPYGIPALARTSASDRLGIIAASGTRLRTWKGDGKGRFTDAADATTPASGSKVGYGYDADGRRTSQTGAAGTITYDYDPAGNLSTTTLPAGNGHTEKRAYDNAGRLTSVVSAKGNAVLSGRQLTLDPAGRPTRVATTHAGQPDNYRYYTYDPAGRLLTDCASTTRADTCPATDAATTYTYDPVGNRKTQSRNGTTTSYTYDDADQLTSAASGSATRGFTYDADGNRTGAGDDTLRYDATGRLVSATSGSDTYTFGYDADGNRVTAGKAGKRLRTTTWDVNGPLATAGTEYDAGGTQSAEYQYNPLSQIQAQTGPGGTLFHHHDQLGSVTDTTDAAGAAQSSYTYGAFGETERTDIAQNPPANPFTFAGGYAEPATPAAGLYLRARDYDPATGRFTAKDPAPAAIHEPYVSTYAYANNTPTRFTDPTGLKADDPDDDHIDSFGEGVKVFGDGFLKGLKMPFEFVGDLYNAFTGKNGGAGGFFDKYVPVRPAYSLYRASYHFSKQGCEELSEVYRKAADELAAQVVLVGLGGLRGWQRKVVEEESSVLGSEGVPPKPGKGGDGPPPLRQAYINEVEALSQQAASMRAAGASPETIARTLHQARRDLGVKYKDLTPEPLRSEIYQRNLQKYGDKLGPTIDWLRAKGKTWEQIIESATRTGGQDLGLGKKQE